MRKWIIFASGMIAVILIFTLMDSGSKPRISSDDVQPDQASDSQTSDSDPNDSPSTATDVVADSSQEINRIDSVIPASGNHEIEVERLIEEILTKPESNLDTLEEFDTETALKLINIASSLADRYRYDAGIAWANDAIRLDPGLPEAYLMSGYLNFKILNTEKAISDFEKTIDLDPLNFDAHLYLGRIYNGNDNPNLGMEYLTRAIEIANSPEAISLGFAYRAFSYGLLDQYDKALEDLEDALFLNPDNGWAVFFQGIIKEEIKQQEMDTLGSLGVPGKDFGIEP